MKGLYLAVLFSALIPLKGCYESDEFDITLRANGKLEFYSEKQGVFEEIGVYLHREGYPQESMWAFRAQDGAYLSISRLVYGERPEKAIEVVPAEELRECAVYSVIGRWPGGSSESFFLLEKTGEESRKVIHQEDALSDAYKMAGSCELSGLSSRTAPSD